MNDINHIFFPLRTNAGWFASPYLLNRIEEQLKRAILLYDEILIEDGGIRVDIGPHGSMEMRFPPGSRPNEQRVIDVKYDNIGGGNIHLSFQQEKEGSKKTTINFGKAVRSINLDFYPIMKANKLNQYNFIKLITLNDDKISQDHKTLLEKESNQDSLLIKDMFDNHFERTTVTKHLNRDILFSIYLRTPISVDPDYSDIIARKSAFFNQKTRFTSIPKESVFRHITDVIAPNLEKTSFDQIIEYRNNPSWKAFRQYLLEITKEVCKDPSCMSDQIAFQKQVSKVFSYSLFRELEKKSKGGKEISIDLALGSFSLLPVASEISSGYGLIKSGCDYFKDQSGWLAFLSRIKDK